MHFVKKANYLGEYKIQLAFEDGTEKAVDLQPYLEGEIFEPLKDPSYFQQFTVHPELATLVWENGADYSPAFLYEVGQEIPSQKTG